MESAQQHIGGAALCECQRSAHAAPLGLCEKPDQCAKVAGEPAERSSQTSMKEAEKGIIGADDVGTLKACINIDHIEDDR